MPLTPRSPVEIIDAQGYPDLLIPYEVPFIETDEGEYAVLLNTLYEIHESYNVNLRMWDRRAPDISLSEAAKMGKLHTDLLDAMSIIEKKLAQNRDSWK